MTDHIERPLRDALGALETLLGDKPTLDLVDAAAREIAARLEAGNKVLVCGNGGSACDAMHFAEELTGRFRDDRRPLAAVACADPGHITCTANDYGFEHVFSRWITALARPGDAAVLLSTSGNSPNILLAAEAARRAETYTLALSGRGGGELAGACDAAVIVPGDTSDRIQELHMLLLHIIVERIESLIGH